MSGAIHMRLIASAAFSLIIWFGFSLRKSEEENPERTPGPNPRFSPYLFNCILPIYLGMLIPLILALYDRVTAVNLILSLCLDTIFTVSLFHCLLLPLMPLLRRYISARSCALLWIVPNYLYYLTQKNFMEPEKPLVILPIPEKLGGVLLVLWLAGVAWVLTGKIREHLAFRRHVLADSRPVTEESALKIWQEELFRGEMGDVPYKLVISPQVRTPLSMGFFRKTTCVILPEKDYTPEELRLVLRHELVHISRQDALTKFFLVFCTAMCWFNPLMWVAMERCAEDLELSCDETVLMDADDATRQQYAFLLLRTAGDSRGFTTCLSASAKALRYRLTNVIRRENRLWGGFVVALAFFLVAMGSGQIAVAYAPGTVEEIVRMDALEIRDASCSGFSAIGDISCHDPDALGAYLGSLQVSRLTGSYRLEETAHALGIFGIREGNRCFVQLRDGYLSVYDYGKRHTKEMVYRVEEAVDWDYIRSLFTALPGMELRYEKSDGGTSSIPLTMLSVLRETNGFREVLYSRPESASVNYISIRGMERCMLWFTAAPMKDYTVTVSGWEGEAPVTLTRTPEENALQLLPYPARYSFALVFPCPEGGTYEAVFAIDIQPDK